MPENISLKEKSSNGKRIIYPKIANFLLIVAIPFGKELWMST